MFRNKRLKITEKGATKNLLTKNKDLMMWGMIKDCLGGLTIFAWILKEKNLKVVV